MKELKTLHAFYNFFAAIPEREWTKGLLQDSENRHCAIGHLGCDYSAVTEEARVLSRLLKPLRKPTVDINDRGPHESAKQNILDAIQWVAEVER